MVFSLIKKLFNGDSQSDSSSSTQSSVSAPSINGEPQLVEFVEFVVQSLVDSPEDVNVNMEEKGRSAVISVECQKQDIGKIIGKNGKTISAIRALVNGAAGRIGKKVNVEIVD